MGAKAAVNDEISRIELMRAKALHSAGSDGGQMRDDLPVLFRNDSQGQAAEGADPPIFVPADLPRKEKVVSSEQLCDALRVSVLVQSDDGLTHTLRSLSGVSPGYRNGSRGADLYAKVTARTLLGNQHRRVVKVVHDGPGSSFPARGMTAPAFDAFRP